MTDNQAEFLPSLLKDVPSLRSGLSDLLIAQIRDGELAVGQKLPTEQEIMQATGVSRTVVREALAELRAQGLISTRQGLGAFVIAQPGAGPFSIVPTDVATVDDLLSVLELRMGIEAEAVALAAARRTDADVAALKQAIAELDDALAARRDGTTEDFAFHRAISEASHNPYYPRLFDTLGRTLMPRQWAHLDQMQDSERKRHIARQRREHVAILDAVIAGDATAARKAIRQHLTKAIERFMELRNRLA
jgi:DNA-binding FadR family transcriptional regulator